MSSRFLFYRQSLIINIIAVVVLMIFSIVITLNPLVKYPSPATLNVVIVFVCALFYLITDLAGLSLLRRIRQNHDVSWQIINRLSIALLLQFIVQLAIAFELISILRTLYVIRSFSSYLPARFYGQIFMIVIPGLVIFFPTSFNIYTTLKLIQLTRNSQREAIGTMGISAQKNKIS